MISEIAWENVLWLKESLSSQLKHTGGYLFSVAPFRQFMKRSWVVRLKLGDYRGRLFSGIESWAQGISVTPLTKLFRMPHWDEDQQVRVAVGGEQYSKQINFLLRSQSNLYCLASHRKTIEELAVEAFTYCSMSPDQTEKHEKAALSSLRKLLRVNKIFMNSEWFQEMVERAVCNRDSSFFRAVANAIQKDLLSKPSEPASEWFLVTLLWFIGGRNYDTRRLFLHDLHKYGILPRSHTVSNLNAELRRLGLTKTCI